jgi:hypothetical protein
VADRRLPAEQRAPAVALAGFLLVVAGSAAALFVARLGASPARVAEFYLGAPDRFVAPRSLAGLLEVAVPHLVAIPLALFALSHVVAWVGTLPAPRHRALVAVSFGAALLDVAGGFAVRYLAPWLAWGKVAAFLALEGTLLAWIVLLVMAAWPVSARAERRAAARERMGHAA